MAAAAHITAITKFESDFPGDDRKVARVLLKIVGLGMSDLQATLEVEFEDVGQIPHKVALAVQQFAKELAVAADPRLLW